MSDLIDRDVTIASVRKEYIPEDNAYEHWFNMGVKAAISQIQKTAPSEQPYIIRCKDCKNQEKFFQKDGRRKDGGYYIYWCSLAEGYSHVCLDDDYCSRAERRTDE